MKMRTVYVLHHGSPGNEYYSMFRKRPRVTMRPVPSAKDRKVQVPLYESPDPFIFNFCLHGTERLLRIKVPLGAIAEMQIGIGEVFLFEAA